MGFLGQVHIRFVLVKRPIHPKSPFEVDTVPCYLRWLDFAVSVVLGEICVDKLQTGCALPQTFHTNFTQPIMSGPELTDGQNTLHFSLSK